MISYKKKLEKGKKKLLEDKEINILEEILNQLDNNQEIKINNQEENKILSNIGLLSIKPKIIVCNVDEENLSKGNQYTEEVKKVSNFKRSYPSLIN